MNKLNINGDDLKELGYIQGKAMGVAIKLLDKNFTEQTKEEVLSILKKVVESPENYLEDRLLSIIAVELVEKPKQPSNEIPLREECGAYTIYGVDNIEKGAIDQMDIAMRLPVSIVGALMPDAHQGYGLPIGGVLATNNAIIPYGVGVDIGCRMALSIYDIHENHLVENEDKYKRELISFTKFGAGMGWHGSDKADHPVLDRSEFNITPFIRGLRDRASTQLGSSGGGNHFAEWGIIEFLVDDKELNIKQGRYLALLTHSGSRGFGATVAAHYTKLAKEICKLPKEAANLAYFDLDSAEGQEYWIAMNLAGDYASACHEIIHQRLTKAIGGNVLAKIENHHNFAWKENWNGQQVVVHRKGATPASSGLMGIIPGSMTAPGFLVRGNGIESSINSASHGAGRQMSRTKAINTITKDQMSAILKANEVTLIGAGIDEAPMAYKDINMVMAAQKELVDVVARFTPKIVRMADDGSKEE
jgi:tRNA-splicing ligase RtcB